MSDMKYTSAPWVVSDKHVVARIGPGPAYPIVAKCNWVKSEYGSAEITKEQRGFNVRLIAAAPDLYRELNHLVLLLQPLELEGALDVPGLATLNGARNALAKAEGRT
jgi:hypothetical protein